VGFEGYFAKKVVNKVKQKVTIAQWQFDFKGYKKCFFKF